MSQTETKRKYRATFILDTRNFQEPVENLIANIKANLTDNVGCGITATKELGQREFARVTDRHFPSAQYVQFEVEAGAKAPAAMQERFRLDRTVNRIVIQSI